VSLVGGGCSHPIRPLDSWLLECMQLSAVAMYLRLISMLGLLDPFDVSYSLIKMHTRGKYLAICLPWQAANYLDIKGLLNLTRQTITDMVKGKDA